MGRIVFPRKPEAEEEIRVPALRPAHGHGRRRLRSEQTGQFTGRGGSASDETFPQYPLHNAMTSYGKPAGSKRPAWRLHM